MISHFTDDEMTIFFYFIFFFFWLKVLLRKCKTFVLNTVQNLMSYWLHFTLTPRYMSIINNQWSYGNLFFAFHLVAVSKPLEYIEISCITNLSVDPFLRRFCPVRFIFILLFSVCFFPFASFLFLLAGWGGRWRLRDINIACA